MTILNRIENLAQKWRPAAANVILVGYLERRAVKAAMEQTLNVTFSDESIRSGNMYYQGMKLVPVDSASFLAVGVITENLLDEHITK